MNRELKKYVECLVAMSADVLCGRLSDRTYVSNLTMIAEQVQRLTLTPAVVIESLPKELEKR